MIKIMFYLTLKCLKKWRQSRVSGRLVFVFLLIWANLSFAETYPSTLLTMGRDNKPVALEPYAQILVDPTGQITPNELVFSETAKQFKPLGRSFSLGFTDSTVWLKFEMQSLEAGEWWLQVSQSILEDVKLFNMDAQGRWIEHDGHPLLRSNIEIDTRRPTFPIQLTPEKPKLLLLRIQSRTSLASKFSLWTPNSLAAQVSKESFVWGLIFGAYLLVIVFYALFALWTRERSYITYAALIFVNFMAGFLTDTWNYVLGFSFEPRFQTTILGVFVSLAPWASLAFLTVYLQTHKVWPMGTKILMRICAVTSIIGVSASLMSYYRESALLIQSFSIILVFFNTLAMAYLTIKGNKKAQLLLFAFSIFHFTVAWRFMRNMGYIEPNYFNEHAYQIGAFIHMLILSTGIFSNYNSLRRETEKQQAKAQAETVLRLRQSEFLSMVSHEVKTPLSVISATADNLQITPGLPISAATRINKIVRNCTKIQDIFQNYLDNEQLLNSKSPFNFKILNISTLALSMAQEFKDTHGINIHVTAPKPVNVLGDYRLISIAITNLLSNAHKYSPENSPIHIVLSTSNNLGFITVTDEGPGIDPHDFPNIFDAYYRGRNAGTTQGSGLGLHLVRYISEQHEGHVEAHIRDTGGMRFTISLPLAP